MGTLAVTALTFADWAKRLDPDGSVDMIAELLTEKNEILEDMLFVEGNLPTGHRTTVRTGLPTVAWRLLNYGVAPTKSTTAQVDDQCGMLEGYAEVDKALADLNGNAASFRATEDVAFLSAMNNEMATRLFYGNAGADAARINGLAMRYSSLSAANAANIVNASGSGSDNTSVWVVAWGPTTAFGIFPKGSQAGWQHKDLGEVTLDDSATPTGRYQGYRTHYKWDIGLTVRDWRYASRIANIDVSDLAAGSVDIASLLIDALNALPDLNSGRMAIYANKTVKTALDKWAMQKSNVMLTIDTASGKPVTRFWGVPIRRCDAIITSEAVVS